MSGKLEKQLIQLKFTAKQLERAARKCNRDSVVELGKVKKAIEKGNLAGAQIYAANVVSKRSEEQNMLRLASRVDAVASKVQTASIVSGVTKNMAAVTREMESAAAKMDLNKVAEVMGRFETQFDNLDVQSGCLGNAVTSTTATAAPQAEIEAVLRQVADAHGLELKMQLADSSLSAPAGVANQPVSNNAETAAPIAESTDLAERLSRLRNPTTQ